MHQFPHRGFTLIELLVVISIIAVLAGMLLPAVSLVRIVAKQSNCQSNMRQLGMGLQTYADDWDGNYMYAYSGPSRTWGKTLSDHMDGDPFLFATRNLSAWRCPENLVQLYRCDEGGTSEINLSYGANGYVTYTGSWATEKRFFGGSVGMMHHTSELAAIIENICYRTEEWATDGLQSIGKDLSALSDKGVRRMRYPHKGRTNVLYADMHTGSMDLVLRMGNGVAGATTKSGSYVNGRFWYAD